MFTNKKFTKFLQLELSLNKTKEIFFFICGDDKRDVGGELKMVNFCLCYFKFEVHCRMYKEHNYITKIRKKI